MLGSFPRASLRTILAVAALVAGTAPTMANEPRVVSAAPRPVKAGKRGLFGGATTASRYGRKGAGVSMAQQQRASRKKRGVARNRVNHR